MLVRSLAVATLVTLACALAAPHHPRPDAQWVAEVCSQVEVC